MTYGSKNRQKTEIKKKIPGMLVTKHAFQESVFSHSYPSRTG